MTTEVTSAMYSAADMRRLIGRSEAALDRDLAMGRVPPPLKLGRTRKWLRTEVDGWLAAGMPDANTWASIKNARR